MSPIIFVSVYLGGGVHLFQVCFIDFIRDVYIGLDLMRSHWEHFHRMGEPSMGRSIARSSHTNLYT